MKLRVLIVDDSAVFRSQIRAAIEGCPEIEVVGQAPNGKAALDLLQTKAADVLTMDLEMPVMGGLETLQELKRIQHPARVIVFSSHTKSGAESTMAALTSGASDFLAKPKVDPAKPQTPSELIRELLLPKILQFGAMPAHSGMRAPAPRVSLPAPRMSELGQTPTKIVVIASSTGGPAALEKIFSKLRGPSKCPILIAQHMPPLFTATLAERLARVSGLDVREAVHGEKLAGSIVRIAPGDYHLRVGMMGGSICTLLDQSAQRNSVRPAADYLLESAAETFGRSVLACVLTGMGADGRDGAVVVKAKSGGVVIQSQETCVVYGMPGAVHESGAYDSIMTLEEIAGLMIRMEIAQGLSAA